MENLVEKVRVFFDDIKSACNTEYFIPGEVDNRGMSFPEKTNNQEKAKYFSFKSSYKR